MGTTVGTYFVQIVPSARGISGSIQNALRGEATTAGTSAGGLISGGIKKAIAAAGIGTALTVGLKTALSQGAELEQNLGGTEAVFGKFAKNIQKQAKTAYMNMGLSASDYMATANKMGSLFQGSGIKQERALKLTSDAMQRAADVASVMGIDTSFAMESIAAAAKGNFTMMDNLGVAMNATTLDAYALEKGINFKWNTASNAEKAELAMKMFMDRTSQYQGNFAKESLTTFSGSLGAMKAAAQDFAANLFMGKDITSSMKALVDTSATFLFHNLIPAIGRIFQSLPVAIGEFMQSGVPRFMEAGTIWVEKLVEGAQTALPGMISNLFNSLVNMSASFGSAVSGFVDVGLKLVKSIADGIIKNIPTIIQTVPKIITNIANIINNNAPKIIATGAVILKNLVVGLIKAIPVLIANIPTIIKAAVAVFEAFQWANIGKLVVSGIAKGLKAGIGVVKSSGKKIGTSIVNAIKSVPSKIKGFVNKIKSHLLFAGLAGKVQSNFNKIKEKITNPIQKAKDKVKGFVDKIKGFFPISIGKWLSNLPTLSLKTASKTILGKTITYPVGFSWNAKAMQQPYMFTGATLFGAGEAGDEMLYGRKALMRDIREATGGNGGTTYNIGDITLDVSNLEDIATLEQFVKIASRAKRFK